MQRFERLEFSLVQWFAQAKCDGYSLDEIEEALEIALDFARYKVGLEDGRDLESDTVQ